MIDAPYLTVNVEHDGPVCVLALHGELDIITVPAFTERMSQVGWDSAERVILDMSELSFADCAGARALAATVRTVPADCPLIVRSLRPKVRRMFELTGLNLETLRPAPDPPSRTADPQAGPGDNLRVVLVAGVGRRAPPRRLDDRLDRGTGRHHLR